MHELICNLHMHTTYSDGSGTHAELAQAAMKAGVDVLLVTDHNTWVQGVDSYHKEGNKQVLLLVGEEVHDQDREPQKNHMLIFGADRELAHLADEPQELINAVRSSGGICFLAHPIDPALPVFNEDDISWVDWEVKGFTGVELWNGFSELKSIVRHKLDGLFYAYFPQVIARGPLPGTLRLWDKLLLEGQKVVAVGGSDAHARHMSLGPIRRVIFPYTYHFSTVNTHILVPQKPSGDITVDKQMIYAALASGNCFIGYDLPGPTRGFRFSGNLRDQSVIMGGEIKAQGSLTLQVKFPSPPTKAVLIKDGKPVQEFTREAFTFTTVQPGVYRVEAYQQFLGRLRTWIVSNPIYVR